MSPVQWNILQSGTIDQIEFIGSPVSAWRAAAPPPLSSSSLHLPVWAGLGWLIQFLCPQCEQRGGAAAAAPLDTRFYRPRVRGLQPRGGKPTSGDQWQCEHQWPESGAVSQLDCDHQLRGPARGSNPQPGATEPPANTSIIGGGHGSQQYTYIDAG